jgi:hypothetical protein
MNNQKRFINKDIYSIIEKEKIDTGKKATIFFRDDKVEKRERKVYKVPIDKLYFRKDNGRIISDVLSYEINKGKLDEITDYGQHLLRTFLENKDPEKTYELKKSIKRYGQLETAVLTCDGFLINGNRRKVVLEQLTQEFPTNDIYKFLEVVILPDDKNENAPTIKEIEQIENKYQLQNLGKAEYYNFDKALAYKRKINSGMTVEEILKDDATYDSLSEKEFKKEIQKLYEDFLYPLESIERYLKYFRREGHYNTISAGRTDSSGRWQAFLDYYKSVYKKLMDPKKLHEMGLSKKDIKKIEEVAFILIRTREYTNIKKKLHQVMRDLPKLISNKRSRTVLYSLIIKGKFDLSKSELIFEDGKPMDERSKDLVWSNKYTVEISAILIKAYKLTEIRTVKDAPFKLLNDALLRLNNSKLDLSLVENTRTEEFTNLIDEIYERIVELRTKFLKFHKK